MLPVLAKSYPSNSLNSLQMHHRKNQVLLKERAEKTSRATQFENVKDLFFSSSLENSFKSKPSLVPDTVGHSKLDP
jgi:hypothetical protein